MAGLVNRNNDSDRKVPPGLSGVADGASDPEDIDSSLISQNHSIYTNIQVREQSQVVLGNITYVVNQVDSSTRRKLRRSRERKGFQPNRGKSSMLRPRLTFPDYKHKHGRRGCRDERTCINTAQSQVGHDVFKSSAGQQQISSAGNSPTNFSGGISSLGILAIAFIFGLGLPCPSPQQVVQSLARNLLREHSSPVQIRELATGMIIGIICFYYLPRSLTEISGCSINLEDAYSNNIKVPVQYFASTRILRAFLQDHYSGSNAIQQVAIGCYTFRLDSRFGRVIMNSELSSNRISRYRRVVMSIVYGLLQDRCPECDRPLDRLSANLLKCNYCRREYGTCSTTVGDSFFDGVAEIGKQRYELRNAQVIERERDSDQPVDKKPHFGGMRNIDLSVLKAADLLRAHFNGFTSRNGEIFPPRLIFKERADPTDELYDDGAALQFPYIDLSQLPISIPWSLRNISVQVGQVPALDLDPFY